MRTNNEIEITQEMVMAGLDAYNTWYASPEGELVSVSTLVIQVFLAMIGVMSVPVQARDI
jgi:hypothetical protein